VIAGRIRLRQHVLALEQLQVSRDELLSLGGRDHPQRLHPSPPLLYIAPLDGLDQMIWRKSRLRRRWRHALRHFAFLTVRGESCKSIHRARLMSEILGSQSPRRLGEAEPKGRLAEGNLLLSADALRPNSHRFKTTGRITKPGMQEHLCRSAQSVDDHSVELVISDRGSRRHRHLPRHGDGGELRSARASLW
jgi:hypothetical protein